MAMTASCKPTSTQPRIDTDIMENLQLVRRHGEPSRPTDGALLCLSLLGHDAHLLRA